MNLDDAFAIIDKSHAENILIGNIGCGASQEEIGQLTEFSHSMISVDFVKLMEWHNGQPNHINLFLFGPYRLLDVATIIEVSKGEKGLLIFADDGGSTMLGLNNHNEVIELAEDGNVKLFDSVTEFMIAIALGIKDGFLRFDIEAGSYNTSGWPHTNNSTNKNMQGQV